MSETPEHQYFPTFEKAEAPNNGYYVYWRGQKWGLLEYPQERYDTEHYGYQRQHENTTARLSFKMVLIHEEPKLKKPKRSYARVMGLRKPK